MNLKKIHQSFISGYIPLLLIFIAFLGMRFSKCPVQDDPGFWLTVAVQVCTAFSLLYVSQTLMIIRERSFLPPFFYLLFTGTIPCFYTGLRGALLAFGVLWGFYFLFSAYQHPAAQKISFSFSLILALGTLFWPPCLLLFPLFWFGLYRLRNLNLNTFFASLTSLLLVYLTLFAWSVFRGDLSLFVERLPGWSIFQIELFEFTARNLVPPFFLFVLFVFSGINIFMEGISEKIKTVSILSYLFTFSLCLFLLLFFQFQWAVEWASILFVPLTLLISHFFTMTKRPGISGLMFFTILFYVGIFVWLRFFPGA